MQKKLLKIALASAFAANLTTAATADDIADLMELSRADFLERTQELFLEAFDVQKELINRVSPGLGDDAWADYPITDAELSGMECMYDTMAELGQLELMAKQLLSANVLSLKAETDPEFDFVTLITDEALIEEMGADVPDEAIAAMRECDYLSATQERMNYSPEFWSIIGQEVEARGLDG
jgi:hypothetical protein